MTGAREAAVKFGLDLLDDFLAGLHGIADPGDVEGVRKGEVVVGDVVVIEDENLCLKRTKSILRCDVILCKI